MKPSQINDLMPKGLIHQNLLTFDHGIWNDVYTYRQQLKKESDKKRKSSIVSSKKQNKRHSVKIKDRESEIAKQKELENNAIITQMAEDVLKIVDDMSKPGIEWVLENAHLKHRISIQKFSIQ